MGSAFPSSLNTWEPSLQLHTCCFKHRWGLEALEPWTAFPRRGVRGFSHPPRALPLCVGFPGQLGNEGGGLGALLRADGLQASALRSLSRVSGLARGQGYKPLAARAPSRGLVWGLVFGVRVQEAAVCAIINLHLLTGSGWAAVSACGLRTRDWLKEKRGLGPWVMLVQALSLSYSSHNTS